MEDVLLIDAAERFVKGEMTPEEKKYFEEIRKNNPDIDQLVVEYTFFLNELENYGQEKRIRHALFETRTKLVEEGVIKTSPAKGMARVVTLWKRNRKIITVAASIAGVVSLVSAGVLSLISTNDQIKLKPLVEKINQQENKTRQIENKVNQLEKAKPAEVKPRLEAKFRATGFMIDAGNNIIITNAHVVKEAKHTLIVENNKGDQFSAEVIYVNTLSDLAVLKVADTNFKRLSAVPFSIKRSNVELGEQIFMLGYPKQEIVYGEGYISAKNGFLMDSIFCQLSTPANEGNSGSPIINRNGELVGVISSRETNAEGVVFAIKSTHILKAIEETKQQKGFENIKTSSTLTLKGVDRVTQIKKMQDYVFMVKGN